MVQRFITVLLRVALVGSVGAEDAKELKGIKATTIIWKKDGAKKVFILSTETLEQKETFNRVGEPIVKTVKVDGPDSIPFIIIRHFPTPSLC